MAGCKTPSEPPPPPEPILIHFPFEPRQSVSLITTGEGKYADHAREALAPEFTRLQVTGGDDPVAEGAFRGEDEDPRCYAPPGASGEEFVNTRVTAYAASALFKLDGKVFGPYYSALGWDREVPEPDPEDLKPYRL